MADSKFIKNKNAQFDITGIGSALLDFTVMVDDDHLKKTGLTKGHMHLIDEARSGEIFKAISDLKMDTTPGGSSANTLAGVANLGGSGIFLGKVGTDKNGDIYISETEKAGVKTHIGRYSGMSGHAITFITPDLERTFATHLGAALHFSADDVSDADILGSKILHLEGYLFEPDNLYDACMKAMKIAKDNGVLISIDLSDPSLIGRIFDRMTGVVRDYADIVFANEHEAKAFTGKEEAEALDSIAEKCGIAVVKLGPEGSLIKADREVYRISAYKTDVANTNGAGDMYAAGLLYGLSRGYPLDRAGRIGSYASSLVVAQTGARLAKKIEADKI